MKGLFTFQGQKDVYFVMEYMKGGALSKILEKEERFEVTEAQFYVAEIILGLEFLHSKGIIHRDLKPENVMLDDKGHCKLVDFGLSEPLIKNK